MIRSEHTKRSFDLSLLIPLLEEEFDETGVRDAYYSPFSLSSSGTGQAGRDE